MSDYLESDEAVNNDSQNNSSNSSSGDTRSKFGVVRPLGNRFPKDPILVAALRKHEEEWKAILASLNNAFGVSVSLGHTHGR